MICANVSSGLECFSLALVLLFTEGMIRIQSICRSAVLTVLLGSGAVSSSLNCASHAIDDSGSEPDTFFCEAEGRGYTHRRGKVDLLLIVDTTSAMSEYRDEAIARLLSWDGSPEADIEHFFTWPTRPDYHIGVLGSSTCNGTELQSAPQLTDCSPPDGDYIEDSFDPWYYCGETEWQRCDKKNYEGSPMQAMSCIATLPADGCEEFQPMEVLRRFLASPEASSFRREGAGLAVIIIGSQDDKSPDSLDSYMVQLDERLPLTLTGLLSLSVIVPTGSSRLESLVQHYPQRGVHVPLAGENWQHAFLYLGYFGSLLIRTCLPDLGEVIDIEPDNPGHQPACNVYQGGDLDRQIPMCAMVSSGRPAVSSVTPCAYLLPSEDCSGWEARATGNVEFSHWYCRSACGPE